MEDGARKCQYITNAAWTRLLGVGLLTDNTRNAVESANCRHGVMIVTTDEWDAAHAEIAGWKDCAYRWHTALEEARDEIERLKRMRKEKRK